MKNAIRPTLSATQPPKKTKQSKSHCCSSIKLGAIEKKANIATQWVRTI